MNKYFYLTLILWWFFLIAVKAQQIIGTTKDDTLINPITKKLNEYFLGATQAYKFNGSVLIAQKDKILLQKGYGLQNVQSSIQNDERTIYQIGSNTKPFTAALILQLQEQEKLSIHDKLNKYLPDFPQGERITIEHLLTHTSGIFNYTDANVEKSKGFEPVSKDYVVGLFKDSTLAFKPGTKHSYSNSGYFLLGLIIEKITNTPYEQVMREVILNPLGMKHSGFDFSNLQNLNKAVGYKRLDEREKIVANLYDSTASYAAGAMCSTTGDMYRWSQAIRNGELLKPATWKKAFVPYKANYGYGWISGTIHRKKIIGHSGGIEGFSSHFVWFPEEDITIILLSNVEETNLGLTTIDIASILFNQPYAIPKKRQHIEVDASVLQQYVGKYKYDKTPRKPITISLENGGLVARKKGEPDFNLQAESLNRFFITAVEAEMEFIKNNQGEIEKMIIHQNGEHYGWEKID